MQTPRPGEFEAIERHFAPLARKGRFSAYGLRDDAATLGQLPGRDLVVTADALVAGVHFRAADPPGLVARKSLRVNLSDLAAKGARPIGYLLCLSLARDVDDAWIAAFAAGLALDQAEFGIQLAGGDTTSTPGPTTIAITAIGEVPAGCMRQRGGARAGDEVWVSGTIGDAALGLAVLDGRIGAPEAAREALAARYLLPLPRVSLGLAAPGRGLACMDVSDGLVQDLGHVAALAGCGAEIEAGLVPLGDAARALVDADPRLLDLALSGGDDYELLFAGAPAAMAALAAAGASCGVPVARIGRLVEGQGVSIVEAGGTHRRLARGGWTHF
ncbi:MAG: thiamine-phosphate kinase [Alphaproteobacteria bacterium]